MKKLSLILLFFPVFVFAQERISLIGNIFDGVTFYPITEANIYNFNSKKYCFTNKEGNFEIFAKSGDTIVVSKSIYRQVLVEITQEIFEKKFFEIPLFYKAIILKEVNVYALPATYEAFKKEFLNVPLTDFYKAIEGTGLTKQDYINAEIQNSKGNMLRVFPSYITSPITALYEKFSKKKKQERLYKELIENEEEIDNLPLKYNREIVSSITQLHGEELLNFMTFCKFSYYDLIKWSPEFIISQIKTKFGDYEFYKALQDN